MSLLPYVNADTRKDELNREFRKQFPHIRKTITLSKIRRLKFDMVQIFLREPTMNEDFLAEIEAMEEENRKNMNLMEA
jgi:hypothetical protein